MTSQPITQKFDFYVPKYQFGILVKTFINHQYNSRICLVTMVVEIYLVGGRMRIQILVLITLLVMLPIVMASIDTDLKFKGKGELWSSTETPGDGGRIVANAKGDVHLNQSMNLNIDERQSQMDLVSNYGGARVKSPQYSLSMIGYNIDAAATISRKSWDIASRMFPVLKSDALYKSGIDLDKVPTTPTPTKNLLNTYLNAKVFVRGNSSNGSVNREIKLGNGERGDNTIAEMQFKGKYDFSDSINMTGVIREKIWQDERTIPIM